MGTQNSTLALVNLKKMLSRFSVNRECTFARWRLTVSNGFSPNNHVAEVAAYGEVVEDGNKCATNKLEIIREIPWAELLEMVNTGKGCSGFRNSGDWNSGNRNKTNFSNGCFNTVEPTIHLFNKPSNWTYRNWLDSEAHSLINQIHGNILEWVYLSNMTDEEKAVHPEAEITGGYLKKLDNSECAVIWWRSLSKREKQIIMCIPNFDKDIFKEITGIDVMDDWNKLMNKGDSK